MKQIKQHTTNNRPTQILHIQPVTTSGASCNRRLRANGYTWRDAWKSLEIMWICRFQIGGLEFYKSKESQSMCVQPRPWLMKQIAMK